MACKLYYKAGDEDFLVGTFRNREKAERFWEALKTSLAAKLGMKVTPIYVETGKGRGK